MTTKVVNKHLLPLNNHPIVAQPLALAVTAGFSEVLIVTSHESASQFARLGEEDQPPYNKLKTYITTQKSPRGIADAIRQGYGFCNDGPVTVCLGDNFFSDEDLPLIADVIAQHKTGQLSGCSIWTKEVPDPRDYGVLAYENGAPSAVLEKPQDPPTKQAVVGLYVFDAGVWPRIERLVPSKRNEYEVADLITQYIRESRINHHFLRGPWYDLGRSVNDYLNTINIMAEMKK